MRIGIVGCGIAGLAVAQMLAAAGHVVEILERAATPEPIGAGLLLQPPGAAVLDALGILDRIESTASKITRLDSRSASGRALIDLDYADLAPALHGLGLRRPVIWSALFDGAQAARVHLTTKVTIASVLTDDGCARLETDDGAVRRYDLAILASGTHSSIVANGLRRRATPYPWGCLWTTISIPSDWPLHVLQQRCRGTGIMVGILPTGMDDGRQTAALYWSVRNDALDAWHGRPISDWVGVIAQVWPEVAPLVAHLRHEDFQHGTYRDVWASPPHAGRILMIGDAAHGTSPQLGQGVTQALRDARALVDCLRVDAPLDANLAAYWAKRKRATAYYRLASRLLTPAFQSSIPGLGLLRDLFAGPLNSLVKRQALLTLAGMKTGLFGSEADAG